MLVVAGHTGLPLFKGGYVGVDIFFILSGFLITSILVKEHTQNGKIAIWRFWGRRLARLYPALLPVLVVFWIFAAELFPESQAWLEVVVSALYLTDISIAFGYYPKTLGHMWSLAVEMHFYLLWPFVVVLLSGLSRRKAILALFVLYIAATAWRIVLFNEHGWMRAYFALDSHASGLVLGSILALLKWRPEKRMANKVGALSLLTILVCANQLQFQQLAGASWGAVFMEVCSATLILSLVTPGSQIGADFARPLFVRIGLWSYGLYLWHFPVAILAWQSFKAPWSFIVTIGVSLILAGLSYEFYEKRAASWLRDRFSAPRPAASLSG